MTRAGGFFGQRSGGHPARGGRGDTAPLPRPISFQNYIDLAEKSDERMDLVASLLIEEVGRRQRHERNLIYRKVAVELKRLRTGNPSEADKNNAFANLRDLSKQIP